MNVVQRDDQYYLKIGGKNGRIAWGRPYNTRHDAERAYRQEHPTGKGHRRHAHSNPKISPVVWVVGGLALAGAGYLTYRYFKTHFTVASGASYAVPANANIALTLPAGGVWTGMTASDGSQATIAIGQTTPMTFTAGAAGTTYTVGWTVSATPQTATITAQ